MPYHSTDTVCGFAGILPETLRRWRRAGLVATPGRPGYTDAQLSEVLRVRDLTAEGHRLCDVYAVMQWPALTLSGGWAFREEEMLLLLHRSPDEDVQTEMRKMATDYCTEDFINRYLRPLNLWLRSDLSSDAGGRLARFHRSVLEQWRLMSQAAGGRRCAPLFLEAVSVSDETEIWMEAIRLTGQGFRVEVAAAGQRTAHRRHEHHLMWCGNGISPSDMRRYRLRAGAGESVMLTGPDTGLRSAAPARYVP
ncbi:MerR family transcriptional regulator [Pantoea sp. JGM49]|uniref:MerR family transcriptional regulator n=1 Tax=Pantoea sp. JGM49 TaxID=2799791 RepID=UPI001BAA5031|nr:MerR family transcriptional regulator [Pantoea sp. JGM49]MBS0883231.1 MerR family transcriptional regulator [Pantoea sp. JGM49]